MADLTVEKTTQGLKVQHFASQVEVFAEYDPATVVYLDGAPVGFDFNSMANGEVVVFRGNPLRLIANYTLANT